MDRREIRQSFSRLVIDRRGWDFSKSSQEVWHCFETSADLFPVVLSFCRIGHWCRSRLVRRNVNWWRRRSRDCVRPYRRCVVALCLWARSWTNIQEDMDSMQNELQTWRKENKENAQALLQEQRCTCILDLFITLVSCLSGYCLHRQHPNWSETS